MSEIDDIYNEIAGAAALEDALGELDGSGDNATALRNDISNGSIVSRNRLVMWLVAYAMFAQQVLYELFRIDTAEMAAEGHYGNKQWFVRKALEFEYGHELIFTQRDAYYAETDLASRIIAQASVVETGYKVIVKVARAEGGGLSKLSFDQRTALQDYFDELRPPIKVEVRSADGDRLRCFAKVVCDAKQGIANIQSNVNSAITAYIQELDFNGVFSLQFMRERILEVAGVNDLQYNQVETRLASSSVWVNIPRIATTYAGWMKVDSDFPLSGTLEFVSSNV